MVAGASVLTTFRALAFTGAALVATAILSHALAAADPGRASDAAPACEGIFRDTMRPGSVTLPPARTIRRWRRAEADLALVFPDARSR